MPERNSELQRVEDAVVDLYFLQVLSTLPKPRHHYSGNPPLIHQLTISGKKYSFIAGGHKPFVEDGDTISFNFQMNGRYRNIQVSSIEVRDGQGRLVERRSPRYGKRQAAKSQD